MRRRIIAIGTTSDIKNNHFTGQSTMFDGVVNAILREGKKVDIVDISSRHRNGNRIWRVIDYFIILLHIFLLCLTCKYSIAYIVTSQSRYGFYRDYLMITICRFFNIRVVTHQFGANYHQLVDALGKKNLLRLQRMTDYISTIIVEGEYMKRQFAFYKGYENKVVVVPNGLPIEGKSMMVPKTYDGHSSFTLFYLGNLIYSKGYFDVLKAVDLLVNRENLNVKCVFAGRFMNSSDDTQKGMANKNDFDNYVLLHHLSDYISYYIGLYGDKKDEFFKNSNVFVLPSYYINEGQPVSIIEAMAYGCVPIVTNYRHIPMMVNSNNGCFVKPKNPESICSVVKSLMLDPDLYAKKSKMCINNYKTMFTSKIFFSEVLNILRKEIN